jgi:hypothetical protein
VASTYPHPSDKAEGRSALWILAGMSIVGLLGLIALLLMSDFPVFS